MKYSFERRPSYLVLLNEMKLNKIIFHLMRSPMTTELSGNGPACGFRELFEFLKTDRLDS